MPIPRPEIARLMVKAESAIKGRSGPIPKAAPAGTKHFTLGTELYGPWDKKYEQIMFGMGCFWCSENVYMNMKGVHSTQVGYAGGYTQNPTYEEVCTGKTGHNEVLRIVFDPEVISLTELLEEFWIRHNPTTLCQQGGDRGTQYRSGIYYYTEAQEKEAIRTMEIFQKAINEAKGGSGAPQIMTEILEAPDFYYAEDYHQQYDAKPGSRSYCGLNPLRNIKCNFSKM